MSDFICQKYTDCSSCSHYQKQIFESLSNFSHFCRANFGKSPRAIRNERDEKQLITIRNTAP